MASTDWTYLNDGLDIATVDRGVTAGIPRPPGGGSFLFGFNSLTAAKGAVALFANLVNFAPMAVERRENPREVRRETVRRRSSSMRGAAAPDARRFPGARARPLDEDDSWRTRARRSARRWATAHMKEPRRWLEAGAGAVERLSECDSEREVVGLRLEDLVVGLFDGVGESLLTPAVLADVLTQRAHGLEQRSGWRVSRPAGIAG